MPKVLKVLLTELKELQKKYDNEILNFTKRNKIKFISNNELNTNIDKLFVNDDSLENYELMKSNELSQLSILQVFLLRKCLFHSNELNQLSSSLEIAINGGSIGNTIDEIILMSNEAKESYSLVDLNKN